MPGQSRDIKVTLLYPPHQSWPGSQVKPNGSLAYPMLGGALIDMGVEVDVFDAVVGNDKDDLDRVFYVPTEMPGGLFRTGVSDERILEEVATSEIVGITSIFSDQGTMVLATVRLIKKAFPDKLVSRCDCPPVAGRIQISHSRRSVVLLIAKYISQRPFGEYSHVENSLEYLDAYLPERSFSTILLLKIPM